MYICINHRCRWSGDSENAHYTMTHPRYDYGEGNWEEEDGTYHCPNCGDEIEEAGVCEDCGLATYEPYIINKLCARCTVIRAYKDGKSQKEGLDIIIKLFSPQHTLEHLHTVSLMEWMDYNGDAP